MREMLERANAGNPQFRAIAGFQPAFEADANMMEVITANSMQADIFELLYSNEEVDVYLIQEQCRHGRLDMYDCKLIGDLVGYEEWLVVQGLIVINKPSQYDQQIRIGKIMLIKAIQDKWGIELQKGDNKCVSLRNSEMQSA